MCCHHVDSGGNVLHQNVILYHQLKSSYLLLNNLQQKNADKRFML